MELKDLIAQAPQAVRWATFGYGKDAFEVEIRSVSRREVTEMTKRINKRVQDVTPNGQKVWKEVADQDKYRQFLRECSIVSWRGLTTGAALRYCQRKVNGIDKRELDREFPFDQDHVDFMLAEGRGQVWVDSPPGEAGEDDDVTAAKHLERISFEDWVWQQTTQLAAETDDEEVREKNVSPSTPVATSDS